MYISNSFAIISCFFLSPEVYFISLAPTPCDPIPCLNSGTCYPGQGQDFTCACTGGFTGDICEIRKFTIVFTLKKIINYTDTYINWGVYLKFVCYHLLFPSFTKRIFYFLSTNTMWSHSLFEFWNLLPTTGPGFHMCVYRRVYGRYLWDT